MCTLEWFIFMVTPSLLSGTSTVKLPSAYNRDVDAFTSSGIMWSQF